MAGTAGTVTYKLKLDDEGHVVVQDGKPVYIGEGDKDTPFDVNYTLATITRLNNEAKELREGKEDVEKKLKVFDGIEDPEKALEAMKTVANLGSGELNTAAQLQEVRDQAKKTAEDQVKEAIKSSETRYKEVADERDSLRSELHGEKIGSNFSRSKYITEHVAIPPDLVQDKFGRSFKYEDRKVIGYDAAGNKLYSRVKPGELAEFDEAIEMLIDAYPYKDQILKGTNNSGGGSEHGAGGGRGTKVPQGNMGGTHKERVDAIKSRFPDLDKA